MLKNKKIFLILLFCIFIVCLSSNVFATVSTSAGEYQDFPLEFNDTTHEIVLINHGSWTNNDHYLAVPKNSGYFYVEGGVLKFINTSGSTIVYYEGEYNNGWYVRSGNLANNSIRNWGELGVDSSEEGNYNTDGKRHIIFCNTIVYSGASGKENNDVFFSVTLPLVVQVVEITQVEEIPKAIVQVLKTIIPVGLIVLSIFLVIYLIRLVTLRQM